MKTYRMSIDDREFLGSIGVKEIDEITIELDNLLDAPRPDADPAFNPVVRTEDYDRIVEEGLLHSKESLGKKLTLYATIVASRDKHGLSTEASFCRHMLKAIHDTTPGLTRDQKSSLDLEIRSHSGDLEEMMPMEDVKALFEKLCPDTYEQWQNLDAIL